MTKKWSLVAAIFFIHSAIFASNADKLRVYSDKDSDVLFYESSDLQDIAKALNSIGVRYERWQTNAELPEDADQDSILEAYKEDVDRLVQENGYKSIDVAKIKPDTPKKEVFRKKFLNEHTHSNDEVRFFVEGSGLFYIHKNDQVFLMLCEKGDLISIPAYYTHWFDMGDNPYFTAIRLFTDADGWIANFTGSDIAQKYPSFDD